MNLSAKGFSNKDAKLNMSNKVTMLNPNAAEFVPSALRSTFGNIKSADPTRLDVPGPSGKAVLDRSESSASNYSDDEAHQYWCRQLPDDITPDFKVMREDESQTPEQLSLAGLSIHDRTSVSRLLGTQQDIYLRGIDNLNLTEKIGYSGATYAEDQPSAAVTYAEDQPSAAFMTLAANNWDKRFINGDHQFTNGREGHHYNVDSRAGFSNNLLSGDAVLENTTINPLEFLALQFPGFSAQNLAEVYYANGCDLNSTMEMLTQPELQVDVNFNQNLSSKGLAATGLGMVDFPALPVADTHNGDDLQQALNAYGSPSSLSRGPIDFVSTVRKLASQDSGRWKYERNGSAAGSVGSSRSSQSVTSSYNGTAKLVLGEKLQNIGAARAAPPWLETGEVVAHMYSESGEEARDFAHLRNVCLEQARQAYLIGNKALAKELSVKGQLYSMKAAHGKARETIYWPRNPVAPEVQGYSRGQNPLIDLHGLHVNEAIHVLKHELSILRSTARSAGQRLQVMVCLGTGHQTKGMRTPARLPIAVEQYLLEEGLPFTQPQPGLLRVVIY